jgi:OHCU decarboxylase
MAKGEYPRDLIGYGAAPPHAQWPKGAQIAVQFVINYEEGGENCILHGDAASEALLSEVVGAQPWPGQRHANMESIYEFGARVGYWRLRRMFAERRLPVTVFAVATALARYPDIVASMKEAHWEIASHGYKWIEYKDFTKRDEEAHILEAIRMHAELAGERPLGFYQGRCSSHTLDIVMQEQGFLYSADSYADEVPYWVHGPHGPQLIVPYTLDANDMRFATSPGFNCGDQFFAYLKDSFDVLYSEGGDRPRMLSVGLHCRVTGRPGRSAALARFLDHVQGHDRVWIATRIDIARHWISVNPPAGGYRPSHLPRALFVARYGDVFEHTPQIAERAHRAGLGVANDTAEGLHGALVTSLRAMTREEKLALINAHPELAGRLAATRQLTADSAAEQGSAGLDRLAPIEFERFTQLNQAYKARFGFPFIMAVKGRPKDEVLATLQTRLQQDGDAEFDEALHQIERIALLRLQERLPRC